jgi:hypothetical protein
MTDFSGKWLLNIGPLELDQQGTRVEGHYAFGGTRCTLSGQVSEGRLRFTYREPDARGEGWFRLRRNGQAFSGQWRAEGDTHWQPWEGSRVGFDGLWDTSFGRMNLAREGDRVHGFYELAGGSRVEGRLEGNELAFTYHEPEAAGEGKFVLSEDGLSFQGQWRPEGRTGWQPWQGVRMLPRREVSWLVVLEVPWHPIGADRDYSFGNMLSEFFTREPSLRVRQRSFTNEAGLRRHLREVTFIAEPVTLVVATHGLPQGIPLEGGTAGVQVIGESLAQAWDLRLLHFSACLLMQDQAVLRGWQGLADRLGLAISGYATSVDWAGSAIIEFLYLDMILSRGMTPAQASEQVETLLPFAGDEAVEGGAIPPAGFRIVLPQGAE